MLVSEWMTREVVTLLATEKLSIAAQIMAKKRIRQIPIVDDDRLIGLLTKSDLLRACPPYLNPFSLSAMSSTELAHPVKEIMTVEVVTVAPDAPLEGAARLLIDKRINALPVASVTHLLAGIITGSDISRALLAALGAGSPGVRITFEVTPGEDVFQMVSALAVQHGARIVNLGKVEQAGRHQAVVRLEKEVPALVEALWQSGHRVSSVARFT